MRTRAPDWTLRTWGALCVAALLVLSWIPGQHLVRTVVLSAHEEHFLAYLVTAAMLAWLTTSAGVLRTAAALTAYAAILELGQYAIPGRDPALADFCASTLGVLTGVAAVWLARRANGRQAQLA